jgi:DNA polymerase-1
MLVSSSSESLIKRGCTAILVERLNEKDNLTHFYKDNTLYVTIPQIIKYTRETKTVKSEYVGLFSSLHNVYWFEKCFDLANKILAGFYNCTMPKDFIPAYKIIKSPAEILPSTKYSLDIETRGLDFKKCEITAVGLCGDYNNIYIIDIDNLHLFKDFFEKNTFILANAKFDLKFLKFWYGFNIQNFEDIQIQSLMLDERSGVHSLGVLSSFYLGVEEYKGKIDFKTIDNRDKTFLDYLAKDVLYTKLLYDCVFTKHEYPFNLSFILYNTTRVLMEMEYNGYSVDGVKAKEVYDNYLERANHAYQQLVDLLGFEININSPAQICRALGVDSASEEVLSGLNTKEASLILEYRHLFKMANTFVKPCVGKDILHTTFNIGGAVTGRLSSSGSLGTGKDKQVIGHNMQQCPRDEKDFKQLLIAPEGYSIVCSDLSGAELRGAAHLADDQVWIESFNEGRDLHMEVAKQIWGENATKAERTKAKSINFGNIYGKVPHSYAKEWNCSLEEATKFYNDWFDKAKGVAGWIKQCRQDFEAGKKISTVFGRERRIPIVPARLKNHASNIAVNMLVQSTCNDLVLLCLIDLRNELEKMGGKARIFNIVHDAIYLYVPKGEELKYGRLIQKIMSELPQRVLESKVKFKSDTEIGNNMATLKPMEEG